MLRQCDLGHQRCGCALGRTAFSRTTRTCAMTTTEQTNRGPDIDRIVCNAVRGMAEISGMPVAFGGPAARDGKTFVVTQLCGTNTQSLMRVRVGAGLGLGGKALAMGRPATVQDYPTAQGITHSYDQAVLPEHLHAMMALPIQVNDLTRAVLYISTRERMSLGDRLLERIAPVLRRMERDLMVEEEVYRRVAALTSGAEPRGSAKRGPRASAEADEVHAELAAIAESVSDQATKDRLRKLCDKVRLMALPAAVDEAATAPVRLAPRECDVLSFVAIGCTNEDIAKRLGLLPNTVKAYVKTAIRKLGVSNRFQAAHQARQAGLIELPKA